MLKREFSVLLLMTRRTRPGTRLSNEKAPLLAPSMTSASSMTTPSRTSYMRRKRGMIFSSLVTTITLVPLNLLRNNSPLFLLTWTAMHPIDQESPLLGATANSLRAGNAEIVISFSGIDEILERPIGLPVVL